MNIPSDLKYVDTHEWVKIEGDIATVGVTDYAQEQLGDVTFVELPGVGAILEAGAGMGSVESVKAASDLYMPVSGEITEFNKALNDHPELVNSDPYGAGWMIKVRMSNKGEKLLSAAEYQAIIAG